MKKQNNSTFRKEIVTEIVIETNRDIIWQVLTNSKEYTQWNPFMSIEGSILLDNKIKVMIYPSPEEKHMFKPLITKLVKNKKIEWLGCLFLSNLFDGRHSFQLEYITEDKTLFIHSEVFSGFLVPLIWPSMKEKTKKGFISMNLALKDKVEKQKKNG